MSADPQPLRGTAAPPTPSKRRLRVYAFDPAASVELDTAVINDAVIELAWDKPWLDRVEKGPVNEYLEVIDYDFPSRTFYEPLDLNAAHLLAQDGLPLSEGRPQFHQQMVFAVAMKTIEDFERALGRHVFWVQPRRDDLDNRYYPDFIKRLRIYPHAMRAANAYYSPAKAALLFGYFKGEPEAPGLEARWVFTCLSADIIAHETSHAILHGMRRRSVEASTQDSLAMHEGFSDIIALMQHFTMRRVVEHGLARTGGTLRSVSLLTGLASQFGRATGRSGALRQALETLAEEQRTQNRVAKVRSGGGKAQAAETRRLADVLEPHDRGQFLVAAIFDTFVTIYERRTADLFRLARVTPGTKDGLPEKLVTRLAAEASKAANSIMQMCVRGLDYLPPVSPTFGEYLRAIITADTDLYPDDPYKYRVAMAEAFRKRGIPVPGCLSYAPDSLCWDAPDLTPFDNLKAFDPHKLFASALGEMHYTPRYGRESLNTTVEGWRQQGESVGAEAAQLRRLLDEVRDPARRDELHARIHDLKKLVDGMAKELTTLGNDIGARARKVADPRPKGRQQKEDDFVGYSAFADPDVAEPNLREEAMRVVLHNQKALHEWIETPDPDPDPVKGRMIDRAWEQLLGLRFLCLGDDDDRVKQGHPRCLHSINCEVQRKSGGKGEGEDAAVKALHSDRTDDGRRVPKFEVHSVRIARRRSVDGRELQQLVAQVTQKRHGYFDEVKQRKADREGPLPSAAKPGAVKQPDFWFRGGATIIVDLDDGRLTHIIRKRIDNDDRLAAQRRFILGDDSALAMTSDEGALKLEPFAFMHGDHE